MDEFIEMIVGMFMIYDDTFTAAIAGRVDN